MRGGPVCPDKRTYSCGGQLPQLGPLVLVELLTMAAMAERAAPGRAAGSPDGKASNDRANETTRNAWDTDAKRSAHIDQAMQDRSRPEEHPGRRLTTS
jgi:hypothetical protein